MPYVQPQISISAPQALTSDEHTSVELSAINHLGSSFISRHCRWIFLNECGSTESCKTLFWSSGVNLPTNGFL